MCILEDAAEKDDLACKCTAAPEVVNGADTGFRYPCLLDHWCLNELEQIVLTFFGLLVCDCKCR